MRVLCCPAVPEKSGGEEDETSKERRETVFGLHLSASGEMLEDFIAHHAEDDDAYDLPKAHGEISESNVGFADAVLGLKDLWHGCE